MKKLTIYIFVFITNILVSQTQPSFAIDTFIYPTTLSPKAPPTYPSCTFSSLCNDNLICDGDFENVTDPMIYNFFIPLHAIGETVCLDNSTDIYFISPTLKLIEHSFDHGLRTVIGGWSSPFTCTNTPSTITAPHGNSFIGSCGKRGSQTCYYSEAFTLRLRRPMQNGKSYTLKFWARKILSSCPNFNFDIRASLMPPCNPDVSVTPGGTTNISATNINQTGSCNYYYGQKVSQFVDNHTWKEYEITFTATGNYSHLVLNIPDYYYPGINPVKYGYFDDFRLTENPYPVVTIASSSITNPSCINSINSISYTICLPSYITGTNTQAINLKANLPTGFTILPNQFFNSLGESIINSGTISSTNCKTLKLEYTVDNSIVVQNQSYNISLTGLSNSTCNKDAVNNTSITIPNYTPTITVSAVLKDEGCSKSNGTIGQTLTGGTSPYTFLWSNGQTTKDIANLAAGTYKVTITDVNGCRFYKSYSLINRTPDFQLNIHTLINCINNTAICKVDIAPPGNYTYSWSHSGGTNSSASFTGLAKTVSVTVTDQYGCTLSASENLNYSTAYIQLGTGASGASVPNSTVALSLGRLGSLNSSKKYYVTGSFDFDNSSVSSFTYCDFILAPGAKMTQKSINANNNLSFKNCYIYTCNTQLAEGIKVQSDPNNYLTFENNLIKDCYKAIEVNGKCNLIIRNNDFIENVVGLHFNNNTSTTLKTLNLIAPIQGNKFIGKTGTIKSPYSLMAVDNREALLPNQSSYYNIPWAGIISYNFSGLTIGNSQAKNTFKDLSIGTSFYNGSHTISNSEYINLTNKPGNHGAYSGYGVYGKNDNVNTGVNANFSFTGLGKSGPVTFDNAVFGMFLYGYSIDNISQTRMTNIESTGIYQYTAAIPGHFNSNITNNNITAKTGGIAVYSAVGNPWAFNANISNNNVEMNAPSSLNVNAVGIRLEQLYNSNYTKLKVEDNVTSCGATNRMLQGIYINNFKNSWNYPITCKRNTINNSNYLYTLAGIQYDNCILDDGFNSVVSNSPTGLSLFRSSSLGDAPIGIFYNNTQGGTFTCNSVNNIRTGIEFFGNCGALNTKFLKNKMVNHFTGLRLADPNAKLAPQPNAGNTFTGSCTNEAFSSQSTKTIFKVGTTALAKFKPSPANPTYNSPLNFFINNGSGDNDGCGVISTPGGGIGISVGTGWTVGNPTLGGGILFPVDGGGFVAGKANGTALTEAILSEVDTAALMGNLVYSNYNPEQRWQAQKDLYLKIEPYKSSFATNSIYRNFITAMDNGNMDEFNTMAEQAQQLYDMTATQEQQYQTWTAALDTLTIERDQLQSNLWQTEIRAEQDSLLGLINQANIYISNFASQIESLLATIQSGAESQAEDIIAINDTIVPSQAAEGLLRDFNSVYFETIGIGNGKLVDSNKTKYMTIANQCPILNPDVIYSARAIVRSYNDSILFYDSILCTQAGYTLYAARNPKQKDEKKLTCHLFPNPTKEYTKIIFSEIPKNKLSFVVSDLQGKIVLNETIELNMNIYGIDTKSWNNGIYLINIIENNKSIFNARLQVSK